MLGKIEGRRRRGRQRMRRLGGISDPTDMSLARSGSWWGTGRPGVLQALGSQRAGHDWARERPATNWGARTQLCERKQVVSHRALGNVSEVKHVSSAPAQGYQFPELRGLPGECLLQEGDAAVCANGHKTVRLLVRRSPSPQLHRGLPESWCWNDWNHQPVSSPPHLQWAGGWDNGADAGLLGWGRAGIVNF